MKEVIKVERKLIASFLNNVNKLINDNNPDKLVIVNTMTEERLIRQLIKEQDESSLKGNKFKQTSFYEI